MGLNIKKQSVHELARAAATRTGLSQTSVIEEALQMYLAQLDQPGERRDRVKQILESLDARWTDADRAALTSDWLYDEQGLPR
jgi:antitoxin VapB